MEKWVKKELFNEKEDLFIRGDFQIFSGVWECVEKRKSII